MGVHKAIGAAFQFQFAGSCIQSDIQGRGVEGSPEGAAEFCLYPLGIAVQTELDRIRGESPDKFLKGRSVEGQALQVHGQRSLGDNADILEMPSDFKLHSAVQVLALQSVDGQVVDGPVYAALLNVQHHRAVLHHSHKVGERTHREPALPELSFHRNVVHILAPVAEMLITH